MRINLSDGSVLEASFDNGKIILWLSKNWIDFRKNFREFLKSQGSFISSKQLTGGLWMVTSIKKLTSRDIVKFACWLERRGKVGKKKNKN